MAQVGRVGSGNVFSIGAPVNSNGSAWDLTSPGTWSNIWFFLSIFVLAAIFLML